MNPSDWISREQFIELARYSKKWLDRQTKAGKIVTRVTGQRGRNGRMVREYAVGSLPPDALEKLQPKPTPETAIMRSPLFANLAPAATTRVALLDPKDQAKAASRLLVIQPLLEYKAAAQGSDTRKRYLQCRLGDGRAVANSDLLAIYLAELHGKSARTIWYWTKKYEKQGGDVALADKRRADKGQSRWAKNNPELARIAAYVFLEDHLSVMVAYETVCSRARLDGVDEPSYETVRAFLNNTNEVSASMKTLALKGRRAYEEAFSPYIRRKFDDVASNELWVSDHAITDVLVKDDIFHGDLHHMRLQMTTMLDFHSRYVAGVAWSEAGSSRSIVTAFRHAAEAYGLPYGFYCDNGKDFQKVAGETAQREREATAAMQDELRPMLDGSVMQRLGIPVTYCIPFHPQSKHVERYHRTFHDRFDRVFYTYTGGAPHLRPDRTTAALAQHQGLIMMRKKGRIDSQDVAAESSLPLASEYIQMFYVWLETWYHATPQRGEGMNGRSPREVFEQDRWKEAKPVTQDQLALLLKDRKECKVDSCAVRLNNLRYVPATDDLKASARMHERTTGKVIVAYDPCDLYQVSVLDEDGYVLCHLQAETLLRQSGDAETRQLIAASMQQRHILARATRDSLSQLGRDVRKGGYQSPAEAMRELAQLPAAVGDSIVRRPENHPSNKARSSEAPLYAHDIATRFLED